MACLSYLDLSFNQGKRQELVSRLVRNMADGWGASNGSLSFIRVKTRALVQTRVSRLHLKSFQFISEISVMEYNIELCVWNDCKYFQPQFNPCNKIKQS